MTWDQIVINRYLDSLGSTLWGRSFDIQSEDGRLAAAQFIGKLLVDLDAEYMEFIDTVSNDADD
jgi:hypothetical protein